MACSLDSAAERAEEREEEGERDPNTNTLIEMIHFVLTCGVVNGSQNAETKRKSKSKSEVGLGPYAGNHEL